MTDGYSTSMTSMLVPTASNFALPVVAANPAAPYSQAGISTSDPAFKGVADMPAAGGHILTVGAGGQFATLAAAITAANNGDVIAIAGGTTLTNDFSYVTKNITIEGVGGMVTMVATIPPPNQKGILVVDSATVTIKNIAFSGVAISDASGGNGAGIRYDSGTMTIANCDFSNNQNGILANPSAGGSISITHSTFENNGATSGVGVGYTHDIYVNAVASLTITDSIIASANIGHEIKSRAAISDIENNIVMDGPGGTSSYEIDLPNGGLATIAGNYIEKGPNANNLVMVTVGEEGVYANSSLTLQGNNFVNDLGAKVVAVRNDSSATASVEGNSLVKVAEATIVSGAATQSANSLSDSAAHIQAEIDGLAAMVAAGAISAISLTDATIPTLTINASQLVSDGLAINAITAPFTLSETAPTVSASVVGAAHALGNTLIFPGDVAQYAITPTGDGTHVSVTGGGATYLLANIQALKFADTTLILAQTPRNDVVTTGNITELYGAVFSRLPDVPGLAYYQQELAADPSLSLISLAENFLQSPEYLNNPAHLYPQSSVGDSQFVTDLYTNLLHRAPGPGNAAWYDANVITPILGSAIPGSAAYASALLEAHAVVVTDFSQSAEFLNDVQVTAQNPAGAQHWLVLI